LSDDYIAEMLRRARERRRWREEFLSSIRTPDGIHAYHGTARPFRAFDPRYIGTAHDGGFVGKGFYFSTTENVARSYAGTEGVLMDCLLSLENPYVFDSDSPIEYRSHAFPVPNIRDIRGGLIAQGYDGVIVRHIPHPRDEDQAVSLEMVAWEATQVRIMGVRPAFDDHPGLRP